LRKYIGELARGGVRGVTCNGNTGDIMSLRPAEKNRVTAIVRESVDAANADAILLMPPHHWLRFGRS
jgi:4-hydroxy-tetrahydrodipicolinate synthase